jgi:hypothetical protein
MKNKKEKIFHDRWFYRTDTMGYTIDVICDYWVKNGVGMFIKYD